MRKQIYVLTIECSYQNVNKNKVGKKVVSKNINHITIHNVFTENTIESLQNCKRSMKKIEREIKKKNKKEIKIKVNKILDSLPVGMSNDIY
jgi:undecaprenyl pyrophosphate synthase